jgi:hypothetical protein
VRGFKAPKVLDIEVTAKDIKEGTRESDCACPIALAVLRATKADRVSVGDCSILVWRHLANGQVRKFYYHMPAEGYDFVRAFDDEGPEQVSPTTLTVWMD